MTPITYDELRRLLRPRMQDMVDTLFTIVGHHTKAFGVSDTTGHPAVKRCVAACGRGLADGVARRLLEDKQDVPLVRRDELWSVIEAGLQTMEVLATSGQPNDAYRRFDVLVRGSLFHHLDLFVRPDEKTHETYRETWLWVHATRHVAEVRGVEPLTAATERVHQDEVVRLLFSPAEYRQRKLNEAQHHFSYEM